MISVHNSYGSIGNKQHLIEYKEVKDSYSLFGCCWEGFGGEYSMWEMKYVGEL